MRESREGIIGILGWHDQTQVFYNGCYNIQTKFYFLPSSRYRVWLRSWARSGWYGLDPGFRAGLSKRTTTVDLPAFAPGSGFL